MATLKYNDIEYNVVYIDPIAGIEGGTGETVDDALKDLPNDLTDNTCYLIRRFDSTQGYTVDLKRSWFASLVNIMFLGMPDNNSPFYQLLDESVKTKWSSDDAKYAAIRCNMKDNLSNYGGYYDFSFNDSGNTTLFKTTTIKTFIAENCYFYRDSDGDSSIVNNIIPGSNNSRRYYTGGMYRVGFIFGFNGGDEIISFNNCKFGYDGYNLENSLYITSNSDVGTDTQKYPEYKCQAYIAVRSANVFKMTNCLINGVSVYSAYTSSSYPIYSGGDTNYFTRYAPNGNLIYVYSAKYIDFSNNIHNQLYRKPVPMTDFSRDLNDMYEPYQGLIYLNSTYLNVNNFELNRLFVNRSIINYGCLFLNANDLRVHKIKINNKFMYNLGDYTGEDESSLKIDSYWGTLHHNYMITINAYRNVQVDTIICDNADNKTNLTCAPVLYLNTVPENGGNLNQYIRNIYINYPDTATNNPSHTVCYIKQHSAVPDWPYNGSPSGGGYNYREIPCNGWSDANSDYLSSNSQHYGYNYARGYLVENLIVKTPLNSGYALNMLHCGIKSSEIDGKVNVYCGVLDLNKLSNHISSSVGLKVRGPSFVKINEYIIDKNYSGYNGDIQTDFVNGQWNSIYINKTNGIIFNEKTMYTSGSSSFTQEYDGNFNCAFICPNYIQDGQFFGRNLYTFAQSWNVRRDGSSSTSGTLRFRNNTGNSASYPLEIGLDPSNGILITPRSTGKKKAVCYLACKNFDPSLLYLGNRNCGIKVETIEHVVDPYEPEKINDIKHIYTSWGLGWFDDTSTWLNDINLKKYRIELPFEVFNTDTQVDVKLWYNWYSVNGVTYMDPGIALVDYE